MIGEFERRLNQKVVICLVLRNRGFETDIISNGRLALAAQSSNPDKLILMDLQMPTMDGCEAKRSSSRKNSS
jgi:CheY-like chemotaxis protein